MVIKSQAAFEDLELEAASTAPTHTIAVLGSVWKCPFCSSIILRVTHAIVSIWALHHVLVSVWKCPFCSSIILRVTHAIVSIWALHHLWMLGSASCVSVGCSKREILPSHRVSKACFQTIQMLLKLESSVGSILNTLKCRSLTTTLLWRICTSNINIRIRH